MDDNDISAVVQALVRDGIVRMTASADGEPRYELTELGQRIGSLARNQADALRVWRRMGSPRLCARTVRAWGRDFVCGRWDKHGGICATGIE